MAPMLARKSVRSDVNFEDVSARRRVRPRAIQSSDNSETMCVQRALRAEPILSGGRLFDLNEQAQRRNVERRRGWARRNVCGKIPAAQHEELDGACKRREAEGDWRRKGFSNSTIAQGLTTAAQIAINLGLVQRTSSRAVELRSRITVKSAAVGSGRCGAWPGCSWSWS